MLISLDGGGAGRRSSWMKLRRCLYSSLLFPQVELLDEAWQIKSYVGKGLGEASVGEGLGVKNKVK